LADRLLFSTDYPHWDFGTIHVTPSAPLSEAQRAKLLYGNAHVLRIG
jgi:predicted TIM-barrel fold metal-dependent hydrolase